MNKVRVCILYLEPRIAKAIREERIQTDYEQAFTRKVSMSSRVERILFQYLKEHGRLPKNP